jgi:hypothetical protein
MEELVAMREVHGGDFSSAEEDSDLEENHTEAGASAGNTVADGPPSKLEQTWGCPDCNYSCTATEIECPMCGTPSPIKVVSPPGSPDHDGSDSTIPSHPDSVPILDLPDGTGSLPGTSAVDVPALPGDNAADDKDTVAQAIDAGNPFGDDYYDEPVLAGGSVTSSNVQSPVRSRRPSADADTPKPANMMVAELTPESKGLLNQKLSALDPVDDSAEAIEAANPFGDDEEEPGGTVLTAEEKAAEERDARKAAASKAAAEKMAGVDREDLIASYRQFADVSPTDTAPSDETDASNVRGTSPSVSGELAAKNKAALEKRKAAAIAAATVEPTSDPAAAIEAEVEVEAPPVEEVADDFDETDRSGMAQLQSVGKFVPGDVGARVQVRDVGPGKLLFVGKHADTGKARLGIRLDVPVGHHSGTTKGTAYFRCTRKHGVLVAPSKVERIEMPDLDSDEDSDADEDANANVDADADADADAKAAAAAIEDANPFGDEDEADFAEPSAMETSMLPGPEDASDEIDADAKAAAAAIEEENPFGDEDEADFAEPSAMETSVLPGPEGASDEIDADAEAAAAAIEDENPFGDEDDAVAVPLPLPPIPPLPATPPPTDRRPSVSIRIRVPPPPQAPRPVSAGKVRVVDFDSDDGSSFAGSPPPPANDGAESSDPYSDSDTDGSPTRSSNMGTIGELSPISAGSERMRAASFKGAARSRSPGAPLVLEPDTPIAAEHAAVARRPQGADVAGKKKSLRHRLSKAFGFSGSKRKDKRPASEPAMEGSGWGGQEGGGSNSGGGGAAAPKGPSPARPRAATNAGVGADDASDFASIASQLTAYGIFSLCFVWRRCFDNIVVRGAPVLLSQHVSQHVP